MNCSKLNKYDFLLLLFIAHKLLWRFSEANKPNTQTRNASKDQLKWICYELDNEHERQCSESFFFPLWVEQIVSIIHFWDFNVEYMWVEIIGENFFLPNGLQIVAVSNNVVVIREIHSFDINATFVMLFYYEPVAWGFIDNNTLCWKKVNRGR